MISKIIDIVRVSIRVEFLKLMGYDEELKNVQYNFMNADNA